jgi:hypothetical protein
MHRAFGVESEKERRCLFAAPREERSMRATQIRKLSEILDTR